MLCLSAAYAEEETRHFKVSMMEGASGTPVKTWLTLGLEDSEGEVGRVREREQKKWQKVANMQNKTIYKWDFCVFWKWMREGNENARYMNMIGRGGRKMQTRNKRKVVR